VGAAADRAAAKGDAAAKRAPNRKRRFRDAFNRAHKLRLAEEKANKEREIGGILLLGVKLRLKCYIFVIFIFNFVLSFIFSDSHIKYF
jgi:hypothetical protein